jgi:hypothetical protein
MWVTIGSCPQCGAPIYAPMNWNAVIPPPPHYTCGCAGQRAGVRVLTTTTTGGYVPTTTTHALRREEIE